MGKVVMNVFKGQRMDITALMKDADVIIDIFKNYHVQFSKKYTSINDNGPSTITFKGLKALQDDGDLGNMIAAIWNEDRIGEVVVKFTSHPPIKKVETTPVSIAATEEPTPSYTTYASVNEMQPFQDADSL